MVYAIVAKDADDWDRAALVHMGKDATSWRSSLDADLAAPLDDRDTRLERELNAR